MKSVLFLFALCAYTAFAQTSNRVSLQLGSVTVWLGMDKAAAEQQIEASRILFQDTPDPNALVIATDLQTKQLYTLKFENNKLAYADRNWFRDDSRCSTFRHGCPYLSC